MGGSWRSSLWAIEFLTFDEAQAAMFAAAMAEVESK
jgi:hypothetical protein